MPGRVFGNLSLVMPCDDGGMKSIPLRNLPSEEWTIISGTCDPTHVMKFYKSIPWLNRGVNLRASAIANMPYRFVIGGEEYKPNELPEPQRSIVELPAMLDKIEGWLSLYGAAYFLKQRAIAGNLLDLQPMHPTTICPEISKEKGLVGFKRRANGKETMYKPEDVLYIWHPSRDRGIGPDVAPATTAVTASQILANKDALLAAWAKSAAINPFILSTETTMQPEERQRLKASLGRMLQGLRNAFGVEIVHSELKIHSLDAQVEELAQRELTDQQREEIAVALGIPMSMIWGNAANYATARQDALNFYDNTIVPEIKIIAAALNAQLFKPMGIEFKPRPDLLEVYQQQEALKADSLSNLVMYGIMTVDEARQQLNLESLEPKPEPAPALTSGNGNGNAPIVEGTARETIPNVRSELTKWRAKAIRRHDEGNPEKALEFESEVLSPVLHTHIRTQLQGAAGRQDINNIFSSARLWESYP